MPFSAAARFLATRFDDYIVSKNITELCEMNYPEPARPKQIYFKTFLPLTPTGKPDIKELEQEAMERARAV